MQFEDIKKNQAQINFTALDNSERLNQRNRFLEKCELQFRTGRPIRIGAVGVDVWQEVKFELNRSVRRNFSMNRKPLSTLTC